MKDYLFESLSISLTSEVEGEGEGERERERERCSNYFKNIYLKYNYLIIYYG